jgi:hypothetical protein
MYISKLILSQTNQILILLNLLRIVTERIILIMQVNDDSVLARLKEPQILFCFEEK